MPKGQKPYASPGKKLAANAPLASRAAAIDKMPESRNKMKAQTKLNVDQNSRSRLFKADGGGIGSFVPSGAYTPKAGGAVPAMGSLRQPAMPAMPAMRRPLNANAAGLGLGPRAGSGGGRFAGGGNMGGGRFDGDLGGPAAPAPRVMMADGGKAKAKGKKK